MIRRRLPPAFDDTTKHNLPKAFADFRNAPDFGGLSAIGLAITEPVWATVKVGGMQKDVLMQGFERRVLTYTPSNPDGFKVEYGNIGRAYYAWRYPSWHGVLRPRQEVRPPQRLVVRPRHPPQRVHLPRRPHPPRRAAILTSLRSPILRTRSRIRPST